MTTNSPLRIGIIGAGAITTLGHIPGLQKISGIQVAAICDSNLDRARAAAARFDIPDVYESYADLLADGEIDAVTIGLPNALHAPATIAALQAGKHVLCEKPLATSVADGEAMVAAARQAGRRLEINMHNRVRADMGVLRAVAGEGRLGKVGYASARWFRRSGIPGFGSWFTRRDLAGGGVLMDIGVHMLDLVLWLLDFPRVVAVRGEVQAVHGPHGRGLGGWGVDKLPGGLFDVEDFAATHLRLADGGLITVEVSWAISGRDEQRVQLFGDQGGADASKEIYGADAPLRLFRHEVGTPVEIIPTMPRLAGSDWDRAILRFVDSIRSGGAPLATAEQALTVLRLLDASYHSALEGREVAV